jgi:nicotinate-nucleotide adenylyltransferase
VRIGYLGGSFDPLHVGHLAIARACRSYGLDEVVLVVAGAPPHKRDRALADATHRVAMARAAAEAIEWLSVDDRETRRTGLSYTVDTVRELLSERPPPDDLFWIIGADSLPELITWRDHEALLDAIGFLVVARPGHGVERSIVELAGRIGLGRAERLRRSVVPMGPVDVSSTEIRRRVRSGEPVAGLVPPAVAEYLARTGLYRS